MVLFVITWEQRKFEYCFNKRNEHSDKGELISITINLGIRKFNELNQFNYKLEDMSNIKLFRLMI